MYFFINSIKGKKKCLANVMYFDDCKTVFLYALIH